MERDQQGGVQLRGSASRDEGGWIPVFHQKHRRSRGYLSLQTIFVDNLPESMDPKGLFTLFTKFGVVKDVFIPSKRKKATRSRFGFVRYECPVAAKVAIQKPNGVWCGNRSLVVKTAEFGRKQSGAIQNTNNQKLRVKGNDGGRNWVNRRPSFAEVVRGGQQFRDPIKVVIAEEYGNGWLHKSVIVTLKKHCHFSNFKKECVKRDLQNVQVQEGGGRVAILSFESIEALRNRRDVLGVWIDEWRDALVEWRDGLVLDQEREVWLRCYGIPLNLWNITNFRKIGEVWGEVLEVEVNTMSMSSLACGKLRVLTKNMEVINSCIKLMNKGTVSTIRVIEEFCSCHEQHKEVNLSNYQFSVAEKEEVKGEEDDEVVEPEAEVAGNVDAAYDQWAGNNKAQEGNSSNLAAVSVVNDTCSVAEEPRKAGAGVGNEDGVPRVIIQSTIGGSPRDTECEPVVGFMKSISSHDVIRPSINLNVVLDQVQSKGLLVGLNQGRLDWCGEDVQISNYQTVAQPSLEVVSGPVETTGQPNHKRIESKQKRVISKSQVQQIRKKGEDNLSSMAIRRRRVGQNIVWSKHGLLRGAIFKVAAEAISSSSSQNRKVSRSTYLRNEAIATIQIGKTLGVEFKGKEKEVIEKIITMEQADLAQVPKRKEGVGA